MKLESIVFVNTLKELRRHKKKKKIDEPVLMAPKDTLVYCTATQERRPASVSVQDVRQVECSGDTLPPHPGRPVSSSSSPSEISFTV